MGPRNRSKIRKRAAATARAATSSLLLAASATGCSGGTSALVDTVRYATRGQAAETAAPPLDPQFSYIRVTIDGRVAFLARGGIAKDTQGSIENWYSGTREVMRLQNGRLVGAVGTTTEWRRVSLPKLPEWSQLARAGQYQWTRERDVMPGYRFGVRDELATVVIPTPAKSFLQRFDSNALTWFEERTRTSAADVLPPARYAVAISSQGEQVVYGEQCLDPGFCFAWQRWSAEPVPNDKK